MYHYIYTFDILRQQLQYFFHLVVNYLSLLKLAYEAFSSNLRIPEVK